MRIGIVLTMMVALLAMILPDLAEAAGVGQGLAVPGWLWFIVIVIVVIVAIYLWRRRRS
jgi:hypothetical protein